MTVRWLRDTIEKLARKPAAWFRRQGSLMGVWYLYTVMLGAVLLASLYVQTSKEVNEFTIFVFLLVFLLLYLEPRGLRKSSKYTLLMLVYSSGMAAYVAWTAFENFYFGIYGVPLKGESLSEIQIAVLIGGLALAINFYIILYTATRLYPQAAAMVQTDSKRDSLAMSLRTLFGRTWVVFACVTIACLSCSISIFFLGVSVLKISLDSAYSSSVIAFATLLGAYIVGRTRQTKP